MNETSHEQLSALMDGELKRDEMRFLLRGIDRNVDLARRWSRYQVARAVLQHQFVLGGTGEDRFATAVMARLEHVAIPTRAARVMRWAGGGAIAAAVAVVALIATRPAGDGGSLPAVSTDAVAVSSVAPLLIPQTPVGQMRQQQPASVPMPAMSASFSDAQPASFESSFAPRYSVAPHTPTLDTYPNSYGPYVLMVGSRQKPEAQTPAPASQDAAAAQ